MKNLLFAAMSFILLSISVAHAQPKGLTQALSGMQSETNVTSLCIEKLSADFTTKFA